MLERLTRYFNSDLAIDLGTVNTRIAVAGEGLVLDEPSLAAVQQRTRRIPSGGRAVGSLAKQLWGRTPDSIAVVRPLRNGVIADFELCEAMLRYFLRKAQPALRLRKPRVVMTVPGGATPVEKRAVFNSAHRAGARRVFLVQEAMAAAIGVGLPVPEPLAGMVCVLGGGTTEVAVISLADIVASRSIRAGGDAMDQAVVAYLRRRYNLRCGVIAAEQLRIDIGSAFPLEEERAQEVRGVDAVSGLPRKAVVTSEEIREALGEPLDEIAEAVRETLDLCSPELAADLLDAGMVLCGGGAMLPGIDRFLAERTGLPARIAPDPMTAVVRGAQICLEHLESWRSVLESRIDDV